MTELESMLIDGLITLLSKTPDIINAIKAANGDDADAMAKLAELEKHLDLTSAAVEAAQL